MVNSDFFDIPAEIYFASESIFDIFLPEIITRSTKQRSFALVFGGKKNFVLGYKASNEFCFKDVFHAAASFNSEIPSGLFPDQWFKDGTALCEIAKFENNAMKTLCKNMRALSENLKTAILENPETNCMIFTDSIEDKILYSFVFFRLDNTRPDLSVLKQNVGEAFFQNRIFSQKKLRGLENPFVKLAEENQQVTQASAEKNVSSTERPVKACETESENAQIILNQKDLSIKFQQILEKNFTKNEKDQTISSRIQKLLESANNLLERKEVCRMILLALASQESIFLFGPPGTAKSMTARWAASILDTDKYFSCLLNQYTQPEELFGPVSIKELENGTYKRITQGYLPESEIVFLDEIWKAGPAILNTLLTICNEKIFKNGNDIKNVPLKLLISASNELPSEDSGLEPLYDRFLIRLFVEPLANKENFWNLITENRESISFKPEKPITIREIQEWKNCAKEIRFNQKILDFLWTIRICLQKEEIYISDRRWKKSFDVMKTCAVLNGRKSMNLSDVSILASTLWNIPEEISKITEILAQKTVESILSDFRSDLNDSEFISILAGPCFEKLKQQIICMLKENLFARELFICECEAELEKQSIKSGMESFKQAFNS